MNYDLLWNATYVISYSYMSTYIECYFSEADGAWKRRFQCHSFACVIFSACPMEDRVCDKIGEIFCNNLFSQISHSFRILCIAVTPTMYGTHFHHCPSIFVTSTWLRTQICTLAMSQYAPQNCLHIDNAHSGARGVLHYCRRSVACRPLNFISIRLEQRKREGNLFSFIPEGEIAYWAKKCKQKENISDSNHFP